jgi:hypothetical protein
MDPNEGQGLHQSLLTVYQNSFGEFMTPRDYEEESGRGSTNFVDWFLFYAATFLILLIMMNLFIGILSEQLSNILENRVRNEN